MTLLDAPAPARNGADLSAPHPVPPTTVRPALSAPHVAEAVDINSTVGGRPEQAAVQEGLADESRRHALWFFWMWLLFATVVSIGGNVIHAWMTAPQSHLKLLAAIGAAVIGIRRYQNLPNSYPFATM